MMLSYFQAHSGALRLVPCESDGVGLRNNQVGGITMTLGHFTTSNRPALICMPTGSGKTAVLMALCYLLRAKRVLVITPSQLVRNQIAEDFGALKVLKRIGVVPQDLEAPKVREVFNKMTTEAQWEEVLAYDVVVATPNSVSPSIPDIMAAPKSTFDLVIFDEAHHSAARSWSAIMDHFTEARQVLLTATPFRNDGREIKAEIVYNYPLRKAHEDGIFGKIQYVPVIPESETDTDKAIALATEAHFRADLAVGFDHRIMIRTDRKSRATELKRIYDEHTSLKLKVVNSDHSLGYIKRVIEQLRQGELNGVICVDMLGEGFDLPNLKIAAIHSPHKSLAITLQFIGRFARTNHEKIGDAKFVAAVNDEMILERMRLFQQDAAWDELIRDLAEERIKDEVNARAFLADFKPVGDDDNPENLSFYSFQPGCHVKVYRGHAPFKLDAELDNEVFPVVFHNASELHNTSVMVFQREEKPRWLLHGQIQNRAYELLVVHYHAESRLMFVCSSYRVNSLYDQVVERFLDSKAVMIPLSKLKRVMAGWQDARFYNVGMRSRRSRAGVESYRTLAGSSAQDAVVSADSLNYVRGHSFGKGKDENGDPVLLGMSSSSKIWSTSSMQVHELVEWFDQLASKLDDPACDNMETPLDVLDSGEEVDELPDKFIIAGIWDEDAFTAERKVVLDDGNANRRECTLPELTITIDNNRCDRHRMVFAVGDTVNQVEFEFSLTPYPSFRPLPGQTASLELKKGFKTEPIAGYFLENAPVFFYEDLSSIQRNVHFESRVDLAPFDPEKIVAFDWAAAKVCIHSEENLKNPKSGLVTIHDYFKATLPNDFDVVIYDQGSGEIADLVAMNGGEAPQIVLYHCKATKASPGDRVEDMYEVCGQAIKSIIWASKAQLYKKIDKARASRTWVKGSKDHALAILNSFQSAALPLEIVVVQPGLAYGTGPLSRKMGDLLAAVENHLQTHAEANFRVICS